MTPCLDPRDLTPEMEVPPETLERALRILAEARANQDAAEELQAEAAGLCSATQLFYRWGREARTQAQAWALAAVVLWVGWFGALYWLMAQRLYTGVPK